MSLTLYMHPLALFCHKVLIGLYENHTPFQARIVDFADEGASAQFLERWSMRILAKSAAHSDPFRPPILIEAGRLF